MSLPSKASVAEALAAAGCVAAEEEAVELLAVATDAKQLDSLIQQRRRGVPLAWLTGGVWFCGHRVAVDSGVFVPRQQSEELARRAADLLPEPRGRAADLCTGAGAVAVHLIAAHPRCGVVGVDIDPRAVACARRNGVPCVLGDLGAALARGAFDVVTTVAPYVPTHALALLPPDTLRYEPRRALDGGGDGLGVLRRAVPTARRLLKPGGWLLFEIGGDQDGALASALAEQGFESLTPWYDEDGDLRGICGQLRRSEAR